MRLSPADKDKLLLATAGMVARDRRARGVKLNHPETVALLSCWVIEGARDGLGMVELDPPRVPVAGDHAGRREQQLVLVGGGEAHARSN